MSFETGTASSVGDLLVKWFNFLQANGWTADVDYAVDGQSPAYGVIQRKDSKSGASPIDSDALNYVNLHVAFVNSGTDADGDIMGIIPMRDYTSGEPVGGGVEVATTTSVYTSANHMGTNFPSTPFEKYWFFESDFYAHAVVEYNTGFFRHFGMGSLNKIGKWQGGEYYYGHLWQQNTSFIDSILFGGHYVGLDTNTTQTDRGPKVYGKLIDGSPFPDVAGRQSPETAWHSLHETGEAGTGIGTDADNRDRGAIFGNGPRSGPHTTLFGLGQVPFNGYRPLFPITLFTFYTGVNPDNIVPLGVQPDVRCISMEGDLQPGEEFTIGSDTWVAFPLTRKLSPPVLDDTEQTGFLGLAYKKVTT